MRLLSLPSRSKARQEILDEELQTIAIRFGEKMYGIHRKRFQTHSSVLTIPNPQIRRKLGF